MELFRHFVRLGLIAGLGMAVCSVAIGQVDQPSQTESDGNQGQASNGSQSAQNGTNPLKILTGVRNRLANGFQARLGIGETYYDQTADAGQDNAAYADTYATAALAYTLKRKHSQYVADYDVQGQYYPRATPRTLVAHDLGLSQSIRIGSRISINNSYRFTLTPNYAPGLLGESAAAQASLVEPLSGVTNSTPPVLVNPLPTFTAPGDGLQTFHSLLMSHTVQSEVTIQLAGQTAAFVDAGFQKILERHSDLFGSNDYTGSVGLTHNFSARTNASIAYQAGVYDFSAYSDRTFSQAVVLSVGHQLLRNLNVEIGAGPSLVRAQGLQTITLPPDVAALLGTPVISRNVSQATLGWIGNASAATRWHRTNITLAYTRAVTSLTGLASVANQQDFSISLGRQLWRRTEISLSGSYLISQFLAVETPLRLNQLALAAGITQQLSSSFDAAAFVDYSKVLSSGRPLNENVYGISLQYHFPRSAR